MRNLTLRNAVFFTLIIATALVLYACLEPESMDFFLKNDDVKDFIKKINETVLIDDQTGDNLTAGYKKITGLKNDKYYMVEILDVDEKPFNPNMYRFVSSDGQLSSAIENIGFVSGGSIINLINEYKYIIWSASILEGEMKLYDIENETKLPTATEKTVTADESGLSLRVPEENYYLNLDPFIKGGDFAISPILPIDPSNEKSKGEFIPGTKIIELKGEDTTTDYIFFDKNYDPGDSFKVLKVKIDPLIELDIILEPYEPPKLEIKIDPPEGIFSHNNIQLVTFEVTNADDFNSDSFEWYYNNKEIGRGSSITIDFESEDSIESGLNAVGSHYITVRATTGTGSQEIFYSATVFVTVNP